MIMTGKLIVAIIFSIWILMVDNPVYGSPPDVSLDENIKFMEWQLKKLKEKKLRVTGEFKEEYFPSYGSTLKKVQENGYVTCGTKDEFPGFSEEAFDAEEGIVVWKGFDVDICRAVSAAIFGTAEDVEYVVVDGKTRFEYLIDGSIDMLSAATTYTFSRNVLKKLEFLPTTFYDGQGFITKKTLGVSSAKQMVGAKICFSGSGTAAKNIADFFQLHEIKYIPVVVPVGEKSKDWYLRGDCDMYGTDRSGLASNRLSFESPERHLILPEIISKEPLGPVVKYGDQIWSDIVRWTVYVLFIAEELGINSENIDDFIEHKDPSIQRFMGELNGKDHPHLGAKLGLLPSWSYDIIKEVGNYREIYERNIVKKLGLKRGLNKLYKEGGLLYAPPLR